MIKGAFSQFTGVGIRSDERNVDRDYAKKDGNDCGDMLQQEEGAPGDKRTDRSILVYYIE